MTQSPSPIVDERPDLQQRLVTALYGPGVRRSDTVEELADALIAVAAALASPPTKAGAGEPVAFVTAGGEVLFADGHNLLALVKAMPEPPFGRKTLPLYATQQPRGDGVRVDDLAQIIRRVDGENKLGAGALAEAIVAALSIEQGETAP